jgi:hypothetical protein
MWNFLAWVLLLVFLYGILDLLRKIDRNLEFLSIELRDLRAGLKGAEQEKREP